MEPGITGRNKTLRRRGVYLLPNAFTTACLFCGFYAIVQAMDGDFERACIAIFIAMVMDSLDGRVARMTHTQSDFGAEYDSLADMVSFGAAPALIMYEWALRPLGKWGWFAAFVYCAGAALRLARFNTNIEVVDKRYFQGLPSPAAAALVVGFIWLAVEQRLPVPAESQALVMISWGVAVYAGVTMVSSVPFYSFKDLGRHKRVPVIVLFLLGIGMFVLSAYPPLVLFSLFVVYGASGYVLWLWNTSRGRKSSDTLKRPPTP
jgi:CDP-diacylglycerol---serine O-phosphatidyltransferase